MNYNLKNKQIKQSIPKERVSNNSKQQIYHWITLWNTNPTLSLLLLSHFSDTHCLVGLIINHQMIEPINEYAISFWSTIKTQKLWWLSLDTFAVYWLAHIQVQHGSKQSLVGNPFKPKRKVLWNNAVKCLYRWERNR